MREHKSIKRMPLIFLFLMGGYKMVILKELVDMYTLEEIKRGFIKEESGYRCLLCGELFDEDQIYFFDGNAYEAKKAVQLHIYKEHGCMKKQLLTLEAESMGLSEQQLEILKYWSRGLSDKEIGINLNLSETTIKSYRSKLNEKQRQSKLFIAAIELIKEENIRGKSVSLWESSKYKNKILKAYIRDNKLVDYPKDEISKQIILSEIISYFSKDIKYERSEIDEKLKEISLQYDLLRKELIAYDYLSESNRGDVYWVSDMD